MIRSAKVAVETAINFCIHLMKGEERIVLKIFVFKNQIITRILIEETLLLR